MLSIGPVEIRWYGMFFAIGLFLSYSVLLKIFKKENLPLKDLDSLVIFLFVGLLVGARAGHILFYNFEYFSQNPSEILKIWHGGLASHGAAIGLLVAYTLFVFIKKVNFSKYVDLLSIVTPITAGFVRLGNFFNSEIYGKPTHTTYGVIFKRLGEDFPRHPSQIYESLIAFSIFGIMLLLYKTAYRKLPKMFLLFTFVFLYFTSRFLVEYFKDRVAESDIYFLSKGQILSILPIAISLIYFGYITFRKFRTK
jgi:prolipoprotein diacylglyceryl transferase